jgi:hypothetical protein
LVLLHALFGISLLLLDSARVLLENPVVGAIEINAAFGTSHAKGASSVGMCWRPCSALEPAAAVSPSAGTLEAPPRPPELPSELSRLRAAEFVRRQRRFGTATFFRTSDDGISLLPVAPEPSETLGVEEFVDGEH